MATTRTADTIKKRIVRLERVFQLGEEIVDAFDTDRKPHQAIVDAGVGAHVFGPRLSASVNRTSRGRACGHFARGIARFATPGH
jgi:hypothetical protein